MKIIRALVTAFEPFGGETLNAAAEALKLLPETLPGLGVTKAILPTSFARSGPALEEALAAADFDIVLCLGEAGGRSAVSLERVAINLDDARIPDNDGRKPEDQPIVPGGPDAYFSRLPLKTLRETLAAAGIPCQISNTAGTFVCNHVMYLLLGREEIRFGGFVHVPYTPAQAAARPQTPSLSAEISAKALRLILEALARDF